MTAEKKTTISAKDVVSIGYDCPHCRATYFVPIAKFDRPVSQCPNCKERWMSEHAQTGADYSDSHNLHLFVEFLRALQTKEFGKMIRLEISGLEKSNEK